MRLSHIRLTGFKSFVEPTTLALPGGRVGVVGPNGCGKSNLIDAVRWVLGESAAGQLRGAALADVIFNGSSRRPPVGRAAVELVFDNQDGTLGGRWAATSEIALQRELHRDGTSHYRLNGVKCRRRDIADLLAGTGLGPRSYAIIEQGTISRLIEARPEELRTLLEEAAGIAHYRSRRRETERRLERAGQNLLRLTDLRDEQQRQVDALGRQARAASQFRELQQQRRQLQARQLEIRWQDQQHDQATAKARAAQAEAAVSGAREHRARFADLTPLQAQERAAAEHLEHCQGAHYAAEAEVAACRAQRQQQARERERLQQQYEALSRQRQARLADAEAAQQQATRHAAQLADLQMPLAAAAVDQRARQQALAAAEAAREPIEQQRLAAHRASADAEREHQLAAAALTALTRREAEQVRQRRALDEATRALATEAPDAALAALRQRLAELTDARAQLARQLAAAGEAARQHEAQAQLADRSLREAEHGQQQLAQELRLLQRLQQAQGADSPPRWRAPAPTPAELERCPLLVERLEVEPGWERAVEVVLGDLLSAPLVPAPENWLQAASSLHSGLLQVLAQTAAMPPPERIPATSLAHRVEGPSAIRAWLAPVLAAEDLAAALRLRRDCAGATVVTADGLWLAPLGLRARRPPPDEESPLARARRLRELATALAAAEAQTQAAQRELAQARAARQQAQDRYEQLQHEAAGVQADQARAEAQLQATQQAATHHRQRLERDRQALAALEQAAAELAVERVRLVQVQAEAEARAREASAAQAEADGRRQQAQVDWQAARQAHAAADQAHAALQRRHQGAAQALAEVRQRLAGLQAGQEALGQRLDELQAALQAAEQAQAPAADEFERLQAMQAQRTSALAAAREALAVRRAALQAAQVERDRAQAAFDEAQAQGRDAALGLQAAQLRVEALAGEWQQTLGTPPPAQDVALPPPEADELAQTTTALAALQRRLERLGTVNLAAVEDLAAAQARRDELAVQHEDLAASVATLGGAIEEIDRESRRQFKATFARLDAGFSAMFPRLFGGGRAALTLTEDDPLQGGITVMAQPPGKRNSRIQLLSGGEKALTAVALVLAIFELNPAPFCLLDEVDAPLDEANVGRFCRLLETMSDRVQFIYITHNKATMAAADRLIGVTMAEPGVSRVVAVDLDRAVELAQAER